MVDGRSSEAASCSYVAHMQKASESLSSGPRGPPQSSRTLRGADMWVSHSRSENWFSHGLGRESNSESDSKNRPECMVSGGCWGEISSNHGRAEDPRRLSKKGESVR